MSSGDSLVVEVSAGSERVLLLLEPDPDQKKRALAHGAGHALSHLDLELGPLSRPVVLELGRRFEKAKSSEGPMVTLENACPEPGKVRLWRRLFGGQRVPRWPLALRSGVPRVGSIWPFDAESTGLELETRRAIFREGRSEEETASDARWLRSRELLVERRGLDLVAAREPADLKRAVAVLSTEPANYADFAARARELGRLFGYPACCVESFVRIRRRDDLMLFADVLARPGDRAPALSLFLNGALGLLSHAPCSPSCQPTLDLAAKILARLDEVSLGFGERWTALASRLHAIDDHGRCFAFELDAPDTLTVRSALEIVAPSPNVAEPQLRPVAEPRSLRVDAEQGILVADDVPTFRASLFARHDG